MRLVLLGAPGVGKGTQAAFVCERRGVPHISTGDIFRAAVGEGSPLGRQVKEYVESGRLVPDDLTAQVVGRRLERDDCRRGFLLDGFPRTTAQAEALEALLARRGLKLDAAVYISAPEDVIVERLAGRRMCSNASCGAGYHLKYMPPRKDGVCDLCGSALYQRPDDTEETIRNRVAVFRRQTEPLVAWYRARGPLREVDGGGTVESVRAAVEAALAGPACR